MSSSISIIQSLIAISNSPQYCQKIQLNTKMYHYAEFQYLQFKIGVTMNLYLIISKYYLLVFGLVSNKINVLQA